MDEYEKTQFNELHHKLLKNDVASVEADTLIKEAQEIIDDMKSVKKAIAKENKQLLEYLKEIDSEKTKKLLPHLF